MYSYARYLCLKGELTEVLKILERCTAINRFHVRVSLRTREENRLSHREKSLNRPFDAELNKVLKAVTKKK